MKGTGPRRMLDRLKKAQRAPSKMRRLLQRVTITSGTIRIISFVLGATRPGIIGLYVLKSTCACTVSRVAMKTKPVPRRKSAIDVLVSGM